MCQPTTRIMHADDVEFIAAVKAFRRPIDDEVETLALRGSGIRIIGFRRMFYGPLRVLLLRFKKTCKICAAGDAITLDIFNNHCTDPLQPPCSLADIPRLAPMAAGKSTITKGSVVQETYQYESLCNTELDRVLAQHAVISVVLEGNCLKVTLVHVSSMGIVSGLHDQLVHQKIRFRPFAALRTKPQGTSWWWGGSPTKGRSACKPRIATP